MYRLIGKAGQPLEEQTPGKRIANVAIVLRWKTSRGSLKQHRWKHHRDRRWEASDQRKSTKKPPIWVAFHFSGPSAFHVH